MPEELLAVPSEIAGMGNLLGDIGNDAWKAAEFIRTEGPPAEWVSAEIIDGLLDYVRTFTETTRMRMMDIGTVTANSGLSLRDAAWLYHDQDNQTYVALNKQKVNVLAPDQAVPALADSEAFGATNPYESAASYPKAQEVKLDPQPPTRKS